jgi:hypothetical protein
MRCDKCGFYGEDKYIRHFDCPNCNYPLIIDGDEEINPEDLENTEELAEEDFMKKEIEDFGHAETWYSVESIADPYERARERTIFFKVGGIIPEGSSIRI